MIVKIMLFKDLGYQVCALFDNKMLKLIIKLQLLICRRTRIININYVINLENILFSMIISEFDYVLLLNVLLG